MIDSKLLLNDLPASIQKLSRKSVPKAEILKAHEQILQKNESIKQVEELRHSKNQASKSIGEWIQKGETQKAEQAKQEVKELKTKLDKASAQLQVLEAQVRQALLNLPNFPHKQAPDGQSSKDNVEILRGNFDPEFFKSQKFLPHWEIMEKLALFDQKRAGKITGSMFAVLKGSGAKLLRSLIAFAFDLFDSQYTEFIVPSLVNRASLTGTGQLPKFSADAYHIEKDDLWAIPTAEVPLTALHREEILSGDSLPLNYMAYTPCFRREAGAAGQENRGLQRLHEFHKLELVKICKPSEGEKELEKLLKSALEPIQLLKLPYRVLDLCANDLTFSSARTYDIEVYSPGTKTWLEVSSVSLFTDYQSRRSQIRYREGKQIFYTHTLNGSGLATPRVMAGILENYYQAPDKVKVPSALIPYLKKDFL